MTPSNSRSRFMAVLSAKDLVGNSFSSDRDRGEAAGSQEDFNFSKVEVGFNFLAVLVFLEKDYRAGVWVYISIGPAQYNSFIPNVILLRLIAYVVNYRNFKKTEDV